MTTRSTTLDTDVRGGPDPRSLDARRHAFTIPDRGTRS